MSEGDKLKVFGQCLGKDLQDTITYLKRSSGAVAFEHVFTILSKNMVSERFWVSERPGRP